VILVDSSAWIDFFSGRDNAAVGRLADLLADGTAPHNDRDVDALERHAGLRVWRH
jgi:hypothetical protein